MCKLSRGQWAYLVQVFQSQDDLGDVDAHLLFGELLPLVEVREELAAADVICNRVREQRGKRVISRPTETSPNAHGTQSLYITTKY